MASKTGSKNKNARVDGLPLPLWVGFSSRKGGEVSKPGDSISSAADDLKALIEAHEETRSSKRYEAAEAHLDRLVQDFAMGLRSSWLAFSRYPQSDEWILQRSMDDLLESVVAVRTASREGTFNAARRELRYLLESTVKYVYVDQQLAGETSLEERIRFLGDNSKVPRSSISPIDDVTLRMVGDKEEFQQAVCQSFSALSGFVHPSRRASEERLARAARGEFSGLEGPKVLEAFTRLSSQTLDLVLTLVFEGIGPSFSGDLFVSLLDDAPRWKFHKTKFVSQVSGFFDYKVERRPAS